MTDFSGKVFKYGDGVNTDVIIPARYLVSSDSENLKAHCMEDIDKTFATRVAEGDVVVGGENFGCGSSREHAPLSLKLSGVKLVIAKSYARIFFRNAINIGLMIVQSAEMADNIDNNDTLSVNSDEIRDLTNGKTFAMPKVDEGVRRIIEAGGLINSIKNERV